MKILVAIENKANRELLIAKCEGAFQADILLTESVHHSKKLLEASSFDLVLMDMLLPDGDSLSVLKQLRTKKTMLEVPAVVISTLRDTATTVAHLEAGANDVLYQPLDVNMAMARLKNVVRIRDLYLSKSFAGNYSAKPRPQHQTYMMDEADNTIVFKTLDSQIPCEMPVLAVFSETQYFCKTIEVGLQSMNLLAFGSLPEDHSFFLQMSLDEEQPRMLKVKTKNRTEVNDLEEGSLKLELRVEADQEWYGTWFLKLNHAYQIGGEDALKNALRLSAKVTEPSPDPEEKSGPNWFHPSRKTLSKAQGSYRYQFKKLLGRGGFASVFLVKDLALKRWVAMKVLDSKMAAQQKARTNFLNEAQIVAQLHHPNLATIFEVGELAANEIEDYCDFPKKVLERYSDNLIYFTMQYIEGESLGKRLKKLGVIPPSEVLRILIEICKGLAYAHEKGLIHRDIKPHNVMLNNNQVILTDFGLADVVDEGGDLFQDLGRKADEGKRLSCTPIYAPPEQLRGKKGDVSSDIYSMAVMAYEMFTGLNPFAAPELNEILKKKVRDLPPSLGEVMPDLHPLLIKVVDKSMAVNSSDRFESISQVLKLLLEVQLEHQNNSGPREVEQQLWDLLNMAIFADDVHQAGDSLTKLNALVCLQQNTDKAGVIEKLRKGIADPDLLNSLIEKNLNNANQDILFQVLKNLESSRSVYILLQWFQRERQEWKKDFFARLAVVCSRENMMPLITFGRELPDREAVLILRGCRQLEAEKLYPALFEWSYHAGLEVQKEWLSIFNNLREPPVPLSSVVKAWSEGTGTKHQQVMDYASKILKKTASGSSFY